MPAAKTTKASTNGHRVIDLNRARAARAEAAKQPVLLKIGDAQIELPVEVPADFALLSADGRVREAVEALFGEGADEFFKAKPSIEDLNELIGQVSEIYGLDEGE